MTTGKTDMEKQEGLRAGRHSLDRLVRPRVGQAWAFGGTSGRHDTVKEVSRGAVGSWRMEAGRLVPLGRATAMWVKWESGRATITVTHLWENWVFVA